MSGRNNNKKRLTSGLGMLAVFAVVMVLVFMPIFGGVNGLDYLDNLYNSISKNSAYYIPDLQKQAKEFDSADIKATLKLKSPEQAQKAALLFEGAGASAAANGNELKVAGNLGKILESTLADSNKMFNNDGKALRDRYQGNSEKLMLYTWWASCTALIKDLNRQQAFAQAKFIETVKKKAVEMSYNFYKVAPQSIGDRWGIVLFSLLFYVVYTMWYGYGVMFFLEGIGYDLEH